MKKLLWYILVFVLTFSGLLIQEVSAQRFPRPEFETEFHQEANRPALPRSDFLEYFDVLVLLAAMSLITWLVFKKRSRRGVFWVSVFSVVYFGFYREGCICAVGSVQNVALALFNPAYTIPFTALAFFLIPLIFALFYGRTFCAGVCPLGAIQDIFAWKPIQLKPWLNKTLGIIPYVYLGLAILYAATATDFIICRYDPFVGFFRINAEFNMIVLGGIFLLLGVFIARPYCRFFCPYSVLLSWMSRFSKYHMTITPSECIQCKLCENSCPFGAIDVPEIKLPQEDKKKSRTRFILLLASIPVWAALGGLLGASMHENLASVHPKVQLAQELLQLNPQDLANGNMVETKLIEAFKTSGKPATMVFSEAAEMIQLFYVGSIVLGIFLGLVIGIKIAGWSIFRFKKDYEPNKANCLSCARCMDFCPVDNPEKMKNLQLLNDKPSEQ